MSFFNLFKKDTAGQESDYPDAAARGFEEAGKLAADNELILPNRPELFCWQQREFFPELQLINDTAHRVSVDPLMQEIVSGKLKLSDKLLVEIRLLLPEVTGSRSITLKNYLAAQAFHIDHESDSAPHRQMTALFHLACLIENLNKEGIEPRLLEIGAGPSIEPFRPKHVPAKPGDDLQLSPGPARVLGMLAASGVLRAELHIVDPQLDPALEEKFATIAHKACIAVRPSAEPGDDLQLDPANDIRSQMSSAFRAGEAFEICLPAANWQLSADSYFDLDSPNFEAARIITDRAPYDVIFAQSTFGIPSSYLLLLKEGGRMLQFPCKKPADTVLLEGRSCRPD